MNVLLPPQRIGIVAANHTGYVEAVFDCLETGQVVVPLRGVDDQDRIEVAQVNQVITATPRGAWMGRQFSLPETNYPALIAFTSGTEGKPKGVILSQANLVEVEKRLNSVMAVDESIREYIGVPVYHSFGFGRCRAVARVGGKFFIPDHGFNPAEIGAMLRQGEINAISAVPSLWRVLLANRDVIGAYGQRVRWIEIGSQYMSRREKEEIKALFPEARIVQHYGLTEASRTTLLEIHKLEGDLLESVGQPLGEVEVRLVQTGQIAIRGKHVAQRYLINGKESALQDEQGWFITNDLGYLEKGYLYYQGRADHVINCSGIKIHPEALESKIYAQVGFSNGLAVCRRPDAMRGEGILVAVTQAVTLDREELRHAVTESAQALGVNAADAIAIVDIDDLPTTATGKVQRKKLEEWYALQAWDRESLGYVHAIHSSEVADIFARSFNLTQVKPQDTFISLGGDSLSYVQLAMQLERHLGYLPQGWEHLSIEQLEQIKPQPKTIGPMETNILLRAVAICAVVGNHASLLPYQYVNGGSMLLLMIAGLNFARFKSPTLFEKQFWAPLKSLLGTLVLPYLLISLGYQFWRRQPNFPVLMMVDNFFNFRQADLQVFPFPIWFINVLIQCIVGFTILLTAKPLHRSAKRKPWRFGLILLGCSVLVGTLSFYWVALSYPDEVKQLPRLTSILFWLFVLGWCIHFSQSRVQKWLTGIALLASLVLVVMTHGKLTSEYVWILLGGVMLLWVPYIAMPTMLKSALHRVSAAAYYIFLTHLIFFSLIRKLLDLENPWLNTIVAILGGVLVWSFVELMQQSRWLKAITEWKFTSVA